MSKLSYLRILTVLLFFSACTSEPQVPTTESPADKLLLKGDAITVANMAKANNSFAFDIFKKMYSNDPKSSFFLSPFSISAAMAMTYAGAAGNTEAEFGKTMHWRENTEALHQSFADLMMNMKKSSVGKEFTINIANRLYISDGIKLFKQFSEINAQKYGAAVQATDFSKLEEAANTINNWVSEQTNKMIPKLLKPDLLKDAKLVLVNAVYFYGGWANKFKEESTQKDTFWSAKTPTVTEFMNQYWNAEDSETKHPFAYTENNRFQVLSLPYAEGKGSMVVFLPKADSSAVKLQEAISTMDFVELNSSLQSLNAINSILELKIPKWKQRSQFDLVSTFKSMGMELPFSDAADFSRITADLQLKIGAIIHEAVVEVSEKGTEAAAATAVITKETIAAPDEREPKVIRFIADRPFFYLIRDTATGSILFMGTYN